MCRARFLLCLLALVSTAEALDQDYPFEPVPFTKVRFLDAFWAPRLKTNQEVTLPYDFKKCEETGRISNFAKAAGRMDGPFEGYRFNDSDVFKIMEGASYSLALHLDPALDHYLDGLIDVIAAAQEEDGYLYTTRTIDPGHPADGAGTTRWSNTRDAHELYNAGHLYEAAVAHYLATGKRSLLDVAIKNADLVDRVFGPDKKRDAPGHEEIEIGLFKLYRVTGEKRYLDLARFFLEERGRGEGGRELYGAYCQDHKPVKEQDEAVGHAVRAGYLYAAMADAAALTGDKAFARALDKIWNNVVDRKLYLTGGIGSQRSGEAFGPDFDLPNLTAYNETCAAIANIFWNFRLFLLHGEGKYMDVLERTLYNGFLAGVSLEGDTFFYPNPLEANRTFKFNMGRATRQPWFGCSCCPANVVRFLPSLPGYVYALRGDDLYVSLYVGGQASLVVKDRPVEIRQTTRYPWDGAVKIEVDPEAPFTFCLRLRLPGWALNQPVPGSLYRFAEKKERPIVLLVNNEEVPVAAEKGYALVRREWRKGDVVELDLPMEMRRVRCDDQVEADRGRIALERGPLVYCLEGIDNGGTLRNLVFSETGALTAEFCEDLLNGVTVIHGKCRAMVREGDKTTLEERVFTALPYYAWSHRGEDEMKVWLPVDPAQAQPLAPPTIASTGRASASHVYGQDSVEAMNDGMEPKSSNDEGIPRFTWWDHRGGEEWARYDFEKAVLVSSTAIYWFDDTGAGACRAPASWRLFYKDGEAWKPVTARGSYGVALDRYNTLSFDPIRTTALRVDVTLRPDFSGGILEWRVE